MKDTLDTILREDTAAKTTRSRSGLWQCLKRVNRLSLGTVVVPTAFATLYFGVVASDIYVSKLRFVVRSPQRQSQSDSPSALSQSTGFSRTQDDAYPITDYIESHDALGELSRNDYILDAYGNHGDILSRLLRQFGGSFEVLWKYYNKCVVTVESDSTSAITTLQVRPFTSRNTVKINKSLLELSEHLINRMNERAAEDMVQFARGEVDVTAAKTRDAAAALVAYRRSDAVLDPDRQSVLRLRQVTTLQTQLFSTRTQLSQLQAIVPQNPQIPVLRTNIAAMERQVQEAMGGVTGGKDSLSSKAANYTRLQLDSQFTDRQLTSAMVALENARAETQRK